MIVSSNPLASLLVSDLDFPYKSVVGSPYSTTNFNIILQPNMGHPRHPMEEPHNMFSMALAKVAGRHPSYDCVLRRRKRKNKEGIYLVAVWNFADR